MPKLKWSDSSSEGKILKRITTAIDKKTSADKLEPKSIDDLLEIGRKMAYISMQKSNLAKNYDWEIRIKNLENIAKLSSEHEQAVEIKQSK